MYKAIIFDLDGTLLDTSKDICKVLNKTLSYFSLPPVSLEQTKKFVGNGAKKLIERAVPKDYEGVEEVYKYYSALFANDDSALTELYEGEDEALKTFKQSEIKLAIVTNKPQDATETVCRRHLSEYGFDFIAGNNGKFPLKPDPALALYAAASLGVKAEECLFVGDGETDVLTAKNAKMDGVAVLWGFRSRAQLKEAGATRFVKNYDELTALALFSNEK